MSRTASVSTTRQLAMLIGIAVILAGGIFMLSIRPSHAAESCAGLDTALQNNLTFIAGQKANPDAQSAARIANRQAVVDLIQQRRAAAGCRGNAAKPAKPAAGKPAKPAAGKPANAANGKAAKPAKAGGGKAGGGKVVCAGDTVTTNGLAGTAGVASGTFPLGTKLRITNLDNNKSITVPVTDVSGSCALLNTAAFDKVHEPGKQLIRRVKIEKIG